MSGSSTVNYPMIAFEHIRPHQRVTFEVLVDEALHAAFAALSGDHSPIHVDEDFCRGTAYKKRIGYAFLLEALLSRLYGQYLPGGSSVCLQAGIQI